MISFKKEMPYKPIGRNLLVVDKKQKGNFSTYEKFMESVSYIIPRRGGLPDKIVEGEEVNVPFFTLAVEIEAKTKKELKQKRLEAINFIKKLEDTEIFKSLEFAVRQTQTVKQSGDLSLASLNYACSVIESCELSLGNVIVHPQQLANLRFYRSDTCIIFGKLKKWWYGYNGKLWGMKIRVSNRVTPGSVFILSSPEYVGVLSEKKIKFSKIDYTDFTYKQTISKEIGVCIINDYSIAKIDLIPFEISKKAK